MTETQKKKLAERMGPEQLARRRTLQARHRMRLCGTSRTTVSLGTIHVLHRMILFCIRVLGLYRIGHRNALDLRIEQNELYFPSLPAAFDGFRILHISDIHIDSNPDLLSILLNRIEGLDADLCVFTGDYREEAAGHFETPIRLTGQLQSRLTCPVYGVLGNHDAVEMVELLEQEGIQMLLNESVELHRNGETLYLAGVDDPYHYRTHHLEKALTHVPDDGFSILLAHSPEIATEAAAARISFYLCGHTHGGQICLPGGQPVMANSRCSKSQRKGGWKHEAMSGYTSRGAGTSSVDVRFNCPPEITIHTLRRME